MTTPLAVPKPTTPIVVVDVAIIGAGPAGCSCALWLQQLGLTCALVDRATAVCEAMHGLHFPQDWVLGMPRTSLHELAARFASHIGELQGLQLCLGSPVVQVKGNAADGCEIELRDGAPIRARAVVLATGLRPRHPPVYFQAHGPWPLDAITLTQQRDQLPQGKMLLLGGGDNAVENAVHLHDGGHQVSLWSRGPLRAAQPLVQALLARPGITLRTGTPMPTAVRPVSHGFEVQSTEHGQENFDQVAVLFGFEPDLQVLRHFVPTATREHPWPNLFFAGDVSERLHPSIASAQADGVTCAKQVQRWFQQTGSRPPGAAPHGLRILSLNGLRFSANLGILEHEKLAPQPIQVDAELHLGVQALVPRDDEIHHVLDYRKVRKIIIEECTAEHTNLLESLIGKLSLRLMQLPGVVGVRVRIAKLEIFDDCEVAIRAELGHW